MKPIVTRSLLLASALLAVVAAPLVAYATPTGPPATGKVTLEDSPDGEPGPSEWTARNNYKEETLICFVTPDYPDLDRSFNVWVYNDMNQRVGYYGLSPDTGNAIPVPAGGYVVLEDNADTDDQDVLVGWYWCE